MIQFIFNFIWTALFFNLRNIFVASNRYYTFGYFLVSAYVSIMVASSPSHVAHDSILFMGSIRNSTELFDLFFKLSANK